MRKIDKYNELFMGVFGVQLETLNEEFTILNVDNWDSIAHMELISRIEDEFEIMLETDDIINFSSYKTGIEILKKYDIEL